MRKPIEQLSEREARARWEKLQARWRELHGQLESLRQEILEQYYWMPSVIPSALPAKLRHRWESLNRQLEKLENEMDEILRHWQVRPFTSCCPASWVFGELTWEEIRTPGQLPRIPPPAYGRTEEEMEQFAKPLDSLVWQLYGHKFL
jgi:hypothetical protein